MPSCKECRKPVSKAHWDKSTQEYKMWHRSKGRAKKRNLDFDIEVTDIVIPERCPVLGVILEAGGGMNAPSLDRVDSSKGYIKGNIIVMSNRANMLKNDASIEELESLISWLRACELK